MEDASDKKPTKDRLHLERSHFLDAFAALEHTLMRLPAKLQDDTLKKEVQKLRLIRNDIVHTELRFIQLEGKLHAVAINLQTDEQHARQARLVNLDDFNWLIGESRRLKTRIEAA